NAGLHHQHQRGAAAERAHRGVVGVEQPERLLERRGLSQFEGRHPFPPDANAARKRSVNFFSISLALARSTGWPMLPSLPASVESIEYAITVWSPASVRCVREVAVSRPTTPIGVPSTLASMMSGGASRVTSTVTLNRNVRYATLVSSTAS